MSNEKKEGNGNPPLSERLGRDTSLIGRFWKDDPSPDKNAPESYTGFIEFGAFGRVRGCKIVRSPKRPGYANDSDWILVVNNFTTGLGMEQAILNDVDSLHDRVESNERMLNILQVGMQELLSEIKHTRREVADALFEEDPPDLEEGPAPDKK